MSFLPGKLDPEYHDFHHSHNVGNFGSMFGFWDTIMNTNKEYRKYKLKNQWSIGRFNDLKVHLLLFIVFIEGFGRIEY